MPIVLDKLKENMIDQMLNCGEVIAIADLTELIIDAELANGAKFDAADLFRIQFEAAESFIDSSAQNEEDTPDVDFEVEAEWETHDRGEEVTPAMIRAERVAGWEAKRPSSIRRAELKSMKGDC